MLGRIFDAGEVDRYGWHTPETYRSRPRRIFLFVVLVLGLAAVAASLVHPSKPRPAGFSAPVVARHPGRSELPVLPTLLPAPQSSAPVSKAARQLIAARPTPTAAAASALATDGIPATALAAYMGAAERAAADEPGCGITWPLLAAIGRVESDHGRFAGAILGQDGISTPPVIGIALNGHGTALITDTDHGRLDGDVVYDHAVGPMQFIPSTWAIYGIDADGDGIADPFDIFDAAASAARYLCMAGGDLTTESGQLRAVFAYNHSASYVSTVLSLARAYAEGAGLVVPVPNTSVPARPPRSVPPANPGPPLGLSKHSPTTLASRSTSSATTATTTTATSSSADSGAPAPSSMPQSSTAASSTPPPSTSTSTSGPPSSASTTTTQTTASTSPAATTSATGSATDTTAATATQSPSSGGPTQP